MVKHNFIVFCKHSDKMPPYVIAYGPPIGFFVLLNQCGDGLKERVQVFELDKSLWMEHLVFNVAFYINEFKAT